MANFYAGSTVISEATPCSIQGLWGEKPPLPIEPISVTDRFPTPEDCNERGFLWVYDPVLFTVSLGWLEDCSDSVMGDRFRIREVSYSNGRPVTHWFPAHLLQVSTPDDGIIP